MKQNILLEKSYQFAVDTIKASRVLNKSLESYILVRQLIRSATSIGANVEESQGGHTRKDFVHKLNISYKEAKETKYWIRLVIDTQTEKKSHTELF